MEGLWWRTYPNPCRRESLLFNRFLARRKAKGKPPGGGTFLNLLAAQLIQHDVRPKWKRHLQMVLHKEQDLDAVLFMNIPVNHISGIPSEVISPLGIPSIFYDGDMPSILPEHAVERGFRFNYYDGADLSEYDLFLVNSDAVLPRLIKMGARKASTLHYGVDPDLFAPLDSPKIADISYFALSSVAREEWMNKLIVGPSRILHSRRFCVAGGPFGIELGNARFFGDLTYSEYRDFCCRSVLNLNITSWTHATARGTSTSRPFELGALQSCIVSQPYEGIEAWFEPEKEIVIVRDERDAMQRYDQLLDNPETAKEFGLRARERILKEHTYRHRAYRLIQQIEEAS